MITQVSGWEDVLTGWAHQCCEELPASPEPGIGRRPLGEAYRRCAAVTAAHSRTFHLASALLPAETRRPVRALYAFCRRADDLVDAGGSSAAGDLERWREQALAARPDPHDAVAVAWADTRRRYAIPRCYVDQFFAGVSRDLVQTRYATFDELAEYAYGVASTVGLMVAHIVGFERPRAIPYAVKLGIALQMTNILRDVGEDWRAGRLYLPQVELDAFGISEDDIACGRVTDRWQRFMAFQIVRNRRLYAEAWPGIAMLHPGARMAIAAAAVLYQGILDDIEAHGGDVFSRRAHLTSWEKLRRLPGIWWRTR